MASFRRHDEGAAKVSHAGAKRDSRLAYERSAGGSRAAAASGASSS